MAVKLANNAVSTLAASITDSADTISVQVADAGKFPTLAAGEWHPATLIDASGNMEIVSVTARAANVLSVERAQEGTTAKAFTAGTRIDVRLTSGSFAAKANDDDLSSVAKSGSYNDLSDKPDLGTAAASDTDEFATAEQGEKADTAVQPDAIDPWAFVPIGLPIPISWGLVGFAEPPKDKSYRYIVLSAGEATTGKYNEGLLTSESVSGSAPNINATAVVNLPGSPFHGSTIPLINTSREYLRPGNLGVQESSQNLFHGHNYSDPGHAHEINAIIGSSGTGGAFGQAAPAANEFPTGRGNARPSGVGITIIGDGGNEARPRARGANFYLRII